MAMKTLSRCTRVIAALLPITMAASQAAAQARPLLAQQASSTATAPDTSEDPHAVQPERPTVANIAGTVAPGWLEVEAGVEHDRFASSAIGYTTPILFKIGLAERWQLGLFGSWSRPAPDINGVGDAGVALKWRLVDDAPIIGDFA